MGRNRSRSRSRDRKKDSHRDKERERNREKSNRDKDRHKSNRKSRSRSRSRHRREKRSRSPRFKRDRSSSSSSSGSLHKIDYLTLGGSVKSSIKQSKSFVPDKPIILNPNEMAGKTEDEIEMLKIMGFTGFDTTKGKHVDGACNAYAVNIQQKRKYRQYMNRKGGFNRPLDPVA